MAQTDKILNTAKKNIKRNKLLSFSTVFVTTIVLAISSLFISAAIFAQKAVRYYEKRAQVIIFFKRDAPEKQILATREKIYDKELIEEILYVSQEDALLIYQRDFADNPDLLATVTADSLPPSLEIRARDIDSLIEIIEIINSEKETNAYIDDILYFKDVVDNLRTLSRIINIGSIVLISGLLLITFSLIRITIGFNINAHRDEIRIMHLVGSTDKFIRLPFILEGLFYGVAGGLLTATLIIVPWYILVYYTQNTDFSFWINQLLLDFNFDFLISINIAFVLIYYLVHMLLGGSLGIISSISAVKRYLGDK
ncbi:MAG: permease-like cell division protein FtsX [Candidatus Dojkabacteria bacterium]|jgi:cell division transport system permease protein